MTSDVRTRTTTVTNSYEKKPNAFDLNDCATKRLDDFSNDLTNVNSALLLVVVVVVVVLSSQFDDDHYSLFLNFFSHVVCLLVDSNTERRNCATI